MYLYFDVTKSAVVYLLPLLKSFRFELHLPENFEYLLFLASFWFEPLSHSLRVIFCLRETSSNHCPRVLKMVADHTVHTIPA